MSGSLLNLIHDTKAVSIWNHKTGPVFWYAASVPGPFYVNTELVIGPELSAQLLEKITAIIASTENLAKRAEELNALILAAYSTNEQYRQVIAALVEKARKEFPAGSYDVISGGERRDWLFSIPFAQAMGTRHVFLFKNQGIYCAQPYKTGEKTLHVSDLVNNAASHFDMWFPILGKAQLPCAGTLCINTRGSNGIERLEKAGQKLVALNRIDLPFFEQSQADGLIDQDTLEEIRVYFGSVQDWAAKYLMGHGDVFAATQIDKKSFERLVNFFTQDPWKLREKHAAFFADMEKAIAARQGKAA